MARRQVGNVRARRALLESVDPILERAYGSPRHGNYRDPTTELFYLLLTVKTRIVDVRPQLRALKKRCGAWNNLANLKSKDIQGILSPLGFGNKRSAMLIEVAKRIESDFGSVSLTRLRKMNDGVALDYLRSLPSVGEKVARCVAMYSLDVDISPMDANATRVLSRIGVLPRGIEPSRAHFWIDRLVQEGASYRLHVNLLAHGQRCCKAVGPRCHECVLADLCRCLRTGK